MPKLIVPQEQQEQVRNALNPQGVAQSVASGAQIGEVQQKGASAAIASGASIGQAYATQGAAATASGAAIGELARTGIPKALSPGLDIGNTQQELGGWLSQRAVKMYNQTMADAKKNTASVGGSQAYNNGINLKSNGKGPISLNTITKNPYDYQTDPATELPKQFDEVRDKVIEQYSPHIEDPVEKQKFANNITMMNESRKADGIQKVREAQLGVATKTLQESLNSDIQNGILDAPENIGFYASTALDRISSALDSGYIDQTEAAKLGENVRKGLYLGSLQTMNQTDPMKLEGILAQKTPEDLNINPLEYKQLLKQNAAALEDQTTLNRIQYQAQKEIEDAQKDFIYSSTLSGIQDGTIHQSQLMEIYNQGKITFPQLEKLATTYYKQRDKTSKDYRVRAEISSAIQNGEMLTGFSQKEIDDHYQNRVRGLSENGSYGSVPFQDKVDVAKVYNGPLQSLSKDIKYSLGSGDINKMKEAVVAYDMLMKTNPVALSDFNKDPKDAAYIAGLASIYNTTSDFNIDSAQRLKDSIYNVDGRTIKARQNEFMESKSFTDAKIKSTIADMYPGGDEWYRGEDYVPDDIVQMVKPLLKQAYMASGDEDTAVSTVLNQTKSIIGHSSLNDVDRWGINAGTLMAFPPEQYSALPPDKLRLALNEEIKDIVPEGVDPNKVFVGSDQLTIDKVRRNQIPSYYLYYVDDKGNEQILPSRWAPDAQTKNMIHKMTSDEAQANVDPSKRVAPMQEQDVQENPQVLKADQAKVAMVAASVAQPKDQQLITPEFLTKIAKTSQVRQIASHYPGDDNSKMIVQASINAMVGKDPSPWRLGQSLKMVNSILLNNSTPENFLKFGTAVSKPETGNLVVGPKGVGLFAGMVSNGTDPYVAMVKMDGKNLGVTYLPLSEVRGFRQLPTPEQFHRQSAIVSNVNFNTERFNPYTLERSRMSTGKEWFNPYTMESGVNLKGKKSMDFAPKKKKKSKELPYSIGVQEYVQPGQDEENK